MKVLLLLLTVGLVLGAVVLLPQQAHAQQYPEVAQLQAFTAEAGFMSLPGYLRWQVFVEQGVWISREEAAEIVQDQLAGG